MAISSMNFIVGFQTLLFLTILPLFHCESIHELLASKGLPPGLVPKDVKSFNLDENGLLEVHLHAPCFTKFENRVFFESVFKGNLSYGKLSGLEGLQQEELFVWLPIKDIIVDDPSSGLILFDVGVVHKQFSLSLFEDPRDCKPENKQQHQQRISYTSGVSRKKNGFDVS
ncbi:Transmembrane protein [Thalictrum thalictroides]|uniref:Transmembrane protein n=1 Tax=Thalictrum thalictroides TaxID=46969 RepID=A0A7J6W385_THATH|nr:Transmembrane protein [Thalictrum thalictroides]